MKDKPAKRKSGVDARKLDTPNKTMKSSKKSKPSSPKNRSKESRVDKIDRKSRELKRSGWKSW